MLESTRLRQEELRLQNEINAMPEVRLADDRGNAEEYETAERRRNEGIGGLAAVRSPDHRGVAGGRRDAAQAAMATTSTRAAGPPSCGSSAISASAPVSAGVYAGDGEREAG